VPPATADESRVVFVLGGEEWCVPVSEVREVLPWRPPRRLADPRPSLRGMVRVRDEVLAVHDVGAELGVETGAEGAIVVLEGADRGVGIAVEAARDVLPPAPVAPAPAASGVIAGVIAVGERTVVAVDAAKLLRALGEKPRAQRRAARPRGQTAAKKTSVTRRRSR
jgi:purine-binding chemotaxis protein CheW